MSAIDYRKLRSLTARQLISALEREGFQLRRHRGPHYRYVHVDGRRVTISPSWSNFQDGHTAQHYREASPLDRSRPEAPQADQELIQLSYAEREHMSAVRKLVVLLFSPARPGLL
jgi:predicted RNA binding protein YcfA (HicA-like mRNA interferase family)